MGMLEKVISLWTWFWLWGTLWWISIDVMFCKWEFWFFDLLMANFSLLECFATFHKIPILERSNAVRRACVLKKRVKKLITLLLPRPTPLFLERYYFHRRVCVCLCVYMFVSSLTQNVIDQFLWNWVGRCKIIKYRFLSKIKSITLTERVTLPKDINIKSTWNRHISVYVKKTRWNSWKFHTMIRCCIL